MYEGNLTFMIYNNWRGFDFFFTSNFYDDFSPVSSSSVYHPNSERQKTIENNDKNEKISKMTARRAQ